MRLFKSYKIVKNIENRFEVYYRKNIFCKWKLMEKYIGTQNGQIYVPAIFSSEQAANIFIEEIKNETTR